MTDVFISYSRRDKDFVGRLYEVLKNQQRDVWVDWEDIPPTADWRSEIRTGIEATNAVIFVISPDSVRSKECRVELELALENHKRLVPLMHRMLTDPADHEAMHPALNAHNWVYLRDEDDFNAGLEKLFQGLDTDLPYVRAHTRLQVRAREWTAENHDSSLLLRGKDLIEAEAWLAGAVNKKPAPTPLHTEYIAASRRAETARGRRLLAGVSVALVVSALLAVLAFGQWQQAASNLELANVRGTQVAFQAATADANALLAQNNAATAVYNEGLSRSVALAAQAQVDLNGLHPDRAVLLGLDALQNYPYTAQAERVLATAVRNFHLVSVLSELGSSVAWSPDGEYLAIGNQDGSVDLYLTQPLDADFNVKGHSAAVTGIAWSPDSARYVSVSVDGTALIQDMQDAENTLVLAPSSTAVRGVDWSPDGTKIVTANADSTASVWDAESGELLTTLEGHEDAVNSAAWSPDSTKIVTGSSDDTAKIWDAESGEELLTLSGHEDHIYSVAWSPDGLEILTASDDKTARSWDAETGDTYFTFEGHTDYVNSAAWSPDGTQILTVSDDKTAKIWDAVNGGQLLSLSGHVDPIWDGDWSPDGTEIVTTSSDGTVRVWNVTIAEDPRTYGGDVAVPVASPDRTLIAYNQEDNVNIADAVTGEVRQTLAGHADSVNSIVWSADSQKIITASDDRTAKVWEVATGKMLLELTNPELSLVNATWSPDSQYIVTQADYPSDYNYQDQVWEAATGKALFSFFTDGSPIIWSADGKKFGVRRVDDETTYIKSAVWDMTSAKPLFESDATYQGWSPDGTRLVGEYNNVEGLSIAAIWDGETGAEIMRAEPGVQLYAFSPDKRLLAGQYFDQGAPDFATIIWDVNTGETLRTLPYVTYLGWLPDSSNLVITQFDQNTGTMATQFFENATSEPLVTFSGLTTAVNAVSWGKDRGEVVTALDDNSVKFWDVKTGVNTLTLSGHNAQVTGVEWSPDGKRIVTVSHDKTAKVWDAETGAELYSLAGHIGTVREAYWLADGGHILTVSDDETIKVWRAWESMQGLIDDAESCCVIRDLNTDEKQQFGLSYAN